MRTQASKPRHLLNERSFETQRTPRIAPRNAKDGFPLRTFAKTSASSAFKALLLIACDNKEHIC